MLLALTIYAYAALPQEVGGIRLADLPAARGIHYRVGDGWIEVPSVVVWPEVNTNWRGVTAIEDRRYVLAGIQARLRVRETTPSFFVRGIEPQREWQLIRLDRRKDYREWRTMPSEFLRISRPMELRVGRAFEFDVRALAHDVFELRPAEALEPGEYALTMLLPGQRWLVVAYDFTLVGERGP